MARIALPALMVALAACGSPSIEAAPFGIGSTTWPSGVAGVQVVFDGLPSEIDGLALGEGAPLSAVYGDGAIRMWAEDLGAAGCPGLAGADLVRSALGGDVSIERTSPDPLPDGVPPFLIGTLPDGAYVAGWSVPGCSWVFAVAAATPELREAAASALADAAAG